MKNYILYENKDDNTYCIAEVLNEGIQDLIMAEEDLIQNGYAIVEVLCYGKFIKCVKVMEKNK